jgi:hypothetical protein
MNIAGGMPPAFRNHRAPTAWGTPAEAAASSLDAPAAIATQNSLRSSRTATGGRPGDDKGLRPDRSDRRFRLFIATSSIQALRRPLESALPAAVAVVDQPARRLAALQGHDQGVDAQPGPQVVGHRPADDLARGQVLDGGEVEPAFVGREVREILSANSGGRPAWG